MSKGSATYILLSAWVCLAAASCDAENHNDVGCADADCAATCEALGFPGGACADDDCACAAPDTDTYAWDASAGDDTDTSAGAAADNH
jgi:hypothetical protein